MRRKRRSPVRFAVYIKNKGYEASLEIGKLYRVIPDESAEKRGCVLTAIRRTPRCSGVGLALLVPSAERERQGPSRYVRRFGAEERRRGP